MNYENKLNGSLMWDIKTGKTHTKGNGYPKYAYIFSKNWINIKLPSKKESKKHR